MGGGIMVFDYQKQCITLLHNRDNWDERFPFLRMLCYFDVSLVLLSIYSFSELKLFVLLLSLWFLLPSLCNICQYLTESLSQKNIIYGKPLLNILYIIKVAEDLKISFMQLSKYNLMQEYLSKFPLISNTYEGEIIHKITEVLILYTLNFLNIRCIILKGSKRYFFSGTTLSRTISKEQPKSGN